MCESITILLINILFENWSVWILTTWLFELTIPYTKTVLNGKHLVFRAYTIPLKNRYFDTCWREKIKPFRLMHIKYATFYWFVTWFVISGFRFALYRFSMVQATHKNQNKKKPFFFVFLTCLIGEKMLENKSKSVFIFSVCWFKLMPSPVFFWSLNEIK